MIRNKLRLFISMIILFIFIQSCEDNSIESGNNTFTVVEGDQIFIKDHKQKKWNITFAVNELGFDPDKFRHGLGVNTIPPILNPQFLNPGDQDYPPISDALVIGYTSQGIVRAYPLGILAHHEVANDFYNHIPVAAAYWPLVRLTAVYSREINGKTLTLAASGWTYERTFVLYDHETESLWYHLSGTDGLTCISGTYATEKLSEFNSVQTRWGNWVRDYPNSQYLKEP